MMLGCGLTVTETAIRQAGATIFQNLSMAPLIEPDRNWDGTAASGFATTPTDPTRTTAKPAMRLITLPNQFFSDEVLVGVRAEANDGGTLIGGIDRVRFHFEGTQIDVVTPSLQTITDANGVNRTHFGHWARLKKPASTQGEAQLYVEAIPADATMQSRVIGPFPFFPHDNFAATGSLHDYEIEISPSLAVVAGSRYQTLAAALSYLRNESLSKTIWNPKITFTEGGEVSTLASTFATFWQVAVKGWTNITATAPTTFVGPAGGADSSHLIRPKFGEMRWIGPNITFDLSDALQYFAELTERLAFEGVSFTNSRGRTAIYRGGPPLISRLLRAQTVYALECDFLNVHNACISASLVRGGTMTGCTGDLFTDAACIIGTHTDTLNVDPWAIDVPALTVQYTGSAAAATLSLTGTSDASTRTFSAKVDGVEVGSFTALNSPAAFTAGTQYTVQNVVDWLNGLTDWTATLTDGTRRATSLSNLGSRGGAFTNVDVKTAPVALATHFDLHADWFTVNIGGIGENVIAAESTAIGVGGQSIFVAASSPRPKDFIFVNLAISNRLENPTGDLDMAFLSCQLGRPGSQSHVVFAHCSIPTQGMLLRTDQGVDFDTYCMIANTAFRSIDWPSGLVDADIVLKNNGIDGDRDIPAGSTGTVVAGDYLSKFADSITGNFSPTGELAANRKPIAATFDLTGDRRDASAPAGALA